MWDNAWMLSVDDKMEASAAAAIANTLTADSEAINTKKSVFYKYKQSVKDVQNIFIMLKMTFLGVLDNR